MSETGNSNRLGQNVNLLTYASLLYLTLAFYAAVWAIPNIDVSGSKTAFSVMALVLGVVNLMVVPNVGYLSRIFRSMYKV
jgi:hypothetical protein